MGEDIASAVSLIVSAVMLVGITAFLSLWVRRANEDELEGKRATPMGLYIVFGAFGFFLFLYGLGSSYRDWREGVSPNDASYLALAVGIIAAFTLFPPLRKLLAKVIPFDPNSWADTIGLFLIASVVALSSVALFVEADEQEPATYLILVVTAVTEVALAFVIVGAPFYRTVKQAVKRLGLEVPTLRQVGIAMGLVFVAFAISAASSLLVRYLQPDLYDRINENLGTMTSGIDRWWGAVILGLCAGIGEEILFRGAIQPKYGIIVTSIVFAVLHQQYGASFVTAGVFGIGILFGLERKYVNTTACIITHVVYNVIAVLAAQAADDEREAIVHFIRLAIDWLS
ncbi:MAG TPA: type II CAAX endopeptidase family protein [Thermomicrobiales bacterium]|nr:type II CAAX endopeptidase family protein [Thermomicrobiales bacterium]